MSDEPPPPLEDSDATPVPPPMSPPSALGGDAVGLGQGKLSEADERNMAMLAHLLGGLASFLGPLVIWLMKREESPFVNDQGREALNFQITVAIGMAVLGIVSLIPFVGCIAVIAFFALAVTNLVFAIMAGLDASKGVAYRYPYALRLVS
ncbi:MAG: DUF4870 domain-containing protein [Verrucomicrobiales bacterium]|nr:DUF4870 domain-containing protein [Verrucomicrobiales bacterium]